MSMDIRWNKVTVGPTDPITAGLQIRELTRGGLVSSSINKASGSNLRAAQVGGVIHTVLSQNLIYGTLAQLVTFCASLRREWVRSRSERRKEEIRAAKGVAITFFIDEFATPMMIDKTFMREMLRYRFELTSDPPVNATGNKDFRKFVKFERFIAYRNEVYTTFCPKCGDFKSGFRYDG